MQEPKRDLHSRDEVTKKRIEKHLSDENDTISEEDIRNIDTDIHKSSTDLTEEISEDLDSGDNEDDPKKDTPTVWEVED